MKRKAPTVDRDLEPPKKRQKSDKNGGSESQNRVIIRVWSGAKDSFGHTSLEIPYMSMLNPNYVRVTRGMSSEIPLYASLWPGGTRGGIFTQFVENRPVQYVLDHKTDVSLEDGREADFTVALYSLNTKAMKKKLNSLIRKTKHWTLSGRSMFRPGSQSCSGVVYDLLVAGGIEELLKDTRTGWFYAKAAVNILGGLASSGPPIATPHGFFHPPPAASSEPMFALDHDTKLLNLAVASPSDIKRLVRAAKEHELEKLPHTYTFDGYSKCGVSPPKPQDSETCCVM